MAKQKGSAIIDLGNVIIAHWLSKTSRANFHKIDYNSIPEVPGAFDGLRQLDDKFGGNITGVYNATDIATEKILGWLTCHKFVKRTGIPIDRVLRTEAGRDKTVFIDQTSETHYGTTVVVDDRLEVMSYFVGKVKNLFLFRPQQPEIETFRHTGALSHVQIVTTWQEIIKALQ